MTASRPPAYRFETAAQWDACLFATADRESPGQRAGLRPLAPFAHEARRIASAGAWAPVVTPAGEILWRDDAGRLHRALQDDTASETQVGPWSIKQARRMVATPDALRVIGAAPSTLESFELDTLTRRQVLEIPDAVVLDLAADGRNTLLVLVERGGRHELVHVGCGGALTTVAVLDATICPIQLASLPTHSRVVLLARSLDMIYGVVRGESKAAWTLRLGALRPCFKASALASDGQARIVVAGKDGDDFGAVPHALVLDADGNLTDAVQLDAPATGIASSRGVMIVSDSGGISIHARSAIAGDIAAVSSELITPLLRAPDSDAALKWQRVDAWVSLPPGTTLELCYGWTTDNQTRQRALKVAGDARLPQSQRLGMLREFIENWSAPITFAGSEALASSTDTSSPLAFPLLDARAPEIWLHAALRATPGSSLPSLTRMHVSYSGSALLEQLPAVYRRDALKPGDFLGALVGTLEATTQDLDRRIATLASLIHPDTAPPRWLDVIAEWLGLPWDDSLAPEQKRAIVRNAARITAQRGTRAGLTTLLQSLFPGDPPRFRIVDVDVDFGLVTLGGATCSGTALPAVLAGLPRSAAVLNRKTILGHARLPCNGLSPSATSRLIGRLRIDITAEGAQRRTWEPWLRRMIESMVPASLRIDLRWSSPARGHASGSDHVLLPRPLPHLGTDAITGYARLPDGRGSTLSS